MPAPATAPEFCIPRFKPLPVSINKPLPTVLKLTPLQLTQPPFVTVFISARQRPNLFRTGTINGPTTEILDAASEIILPTPTPEILPSLAPEILSRPVPAF